MIDKKSFWKDRFKRYGHTGWSNFATYAYDQKLRLKAIEALIGSKKLNSALDYGCGNGDFSYLLSSRSDNVLAYDISEEVVDCAKTKNYSNNLLYTNNANDIFERKYDLILSVTVLQHIVDDVELKTLVEKFYRVVNKGGCIVILETFADIESNMGYFKLRKISDFVDLFKRFGFVEVSNTGFYHPTQCPTKNYLRYKNNFFIRIISRLTGLKIPGCHSLLQWFSKRYADQDSDFLGKLSSPTRVIVFEKI